MAEQQPGKQGETPTISDCLFSPEMKHILASTGDVDLDNIDRDLIELVVAGVYAQQRKHLVWVVKESENRAELAAKLKLWLRLLACRGVAVVFYSLPFKDPYIDNDSDFTAIGHKARLISRLREKRKAIVITTLAALDIKIEPFSESAAFLLDLAVGQEINRGDLTARLLDMRYQAVNQVDDRGDAAWRGSIVDVFPLDQENPVRIEIEAGRVISLRFFDPDTQKSIEQIDRVSIPLARFFVHSPTIDEYFRGQAQEMVYLTELLGDFRLLVSDKRQVEEERDKLLNHFRKIQAIARENNRPVEPVEQVFSFSLGQYPLLNIGETYNQVSGQSEWLRQQKGLTDLDYGDLAAIKDQVENRGYRLFVFSSQEKLADKLRDHFKLFYPIDQKIPVSFENRLTRCLFLAERRYRYVDKRERLDRPPQVKSDQLIKDIQVADLVVHTRHGVGRFAGFSWLELEGHVSEFLKIEYLNREYLYVPVYELDSLSKYVSLEGQEPSLDKMGGSSWNLKQTRAKKSIIHFARELLDLYAVRKSIKGKTYLKDAELEDKLEEGFHYVETTDQKRAIKEVLADLEAEFPMDRLICGDVSFGKTEVAVRAAFRVILSGRQVAFLCPTTILAHQHYATLRERFAPFPIQIGMLSRLVAPAERKKLIGDLKDGKIDLVIGTHALIAHQVAFKNLGLYIIDEEQRFGVFQKERLKQSREDIDVLSLSATPIPRTLSLSLAGLQDISIIQTPPIGRLAIKNYVGYFSREIVTSAVLNEIERGGQVFIVYNNIGRIYTFKEHLEKWLPELPIIVIHAQMKPEEIEQGLFSFISGQKRILLSTTIIENGIDIPGVNTLIVVDADRFGLTQLYQLRGRIGRGSRQAYAYFLVESLDVSEKARARLDAIREFTSLGSGFRLAEFDLKLRGAGSLLGNRQHGHIEALGFDYYLELLNRTVRELKGEIDKKKEPRVTIHFSYSVDPGYIKDSVERIRFYQRILEAREIDDIEELRRELQDRFGKLPESIDKIFFAGLIRLLAKKYQWEEADVFLDQVVIRLAGAPEPFTFPFPHYNQFLERFQALAEEPSGT